MQETINLIEVSTFRQIWDMFPEKRCWMPNKFYKVVPTDRMDRLFFPDTLNSNSVMTS